MKKINMWLLLTTIIAIYSSTLFTLEAELTNKNILTETECTENIPNIVISITEETSADLSSTDTIETDNQAQTENIHPLEEDEQTQEVLATDMSESQAFEHFKYNSASVLPVYTAKNNKRYFILAREAYGRLTGVKGTYDDFGGAKESEDNNPLISAAREFFEEAILDKSLNFSFEKTCDYVKEKTLFVIANTTRKNNKHVTYIVDFQEYKNQFTNTFYTARKASNKHVNIEKDRIALVEWDALKETVSYSKDNNSVYVEAIVINPTSLKKQKRQIKLRSYFVIKLKKFFLDKPYTTSEDKKVRFYS